MKNKEIIKAWLDGADIQYIAPNGNVTDIRPVDEIKALEWAFDDHGEYRIKPITIKYWRVGILNDADKFEFVFAETDNEDKFKHCENFILSDSRFIKWVTPWNALTEFDMKAK